VDGDLMTPGGIEVPQGAMRWRFSRGTGPGGQGVNTTDSRVELLVDLTALRGPGDAPARIVERLGDSIRIVAAEERSQLRNRKAAVDRLVAQLDAAARRRRTRTPTRPTRASARRRLATKRARSQIKAGRRSPPPDAD
jgi:ribosome-associated protein